MRATDFVESYFEAWNHRDPLAVADHLAANGIYCDVPEHSRHSHDELVAHLRKFFSESHHQYRLIGDVLAGEQTIAFQYEMLPADGAATHAPTRATPWSRVHNAARRCGAQHRRLLRFADARGAFRSRAHDVPCNL
ncbi:MAG: nuclear transport factor 2 family protein [Woeseiaceae bacterium]|nr:nuclear transport factor 2 family protein [Woeseiaceae bacterium]